MGHAFEHCKFKKKSKIKRFGEKKKTVCGLDFFLQRFYSAFGSSALTLVTTNRHGFCQGEGRFPLLYICTIRILANKIKNNQACVPVLF